MTGRGYTPRERFDMKVRKTETCWLWIAGKTANGYGMFGGEDTTRTTTAHRWAYEHFVGPIPKGLVVDHLCRVRHCVNPDHLEPVTGTENLRRGRAAKAARLASEGLSVKTAGEMLGLSAWQVKGLCDKGLIDSGFSGRTRLVKVSSIQAYADGLPSERPELSA